MAMTRVGVNSCVESRKKRSANIVLTGREKNSLAFFANDTCLVAKNALFLQSF
jgi:hypothetical protein